MRAREDNHHKELPHTKNWGKFKFRDLPPHPKPDDYVPPEARQPDPSGRKDHVSADARCEMNGDEFTGARMQVSS